MAEKVYVSAFRSTIGLKSMVLDIGAGRGGFACLMANRGAHVHAVSLDTQKPEQVHPRVQFDRVPIETWYTRPNSTKYTHVLMRNVRPFLQDVFVEARLEPWLWEHTAPRALIAIHAFHRHPEGWDTSIVSSLWSRRDLQMVFERWTHVMSEQLGARLCVDQTQTRRRFWSTYALFRRPA